MQKGQDIGHNIEIRQIQTKGKYPSLEDFVLEKSIFSNIFEKDIRRVFIYKKAERLAKAIHLITPAFAESASLRNRLDAIALGLVDAAILPPGVSRSALSRELLALSSVLSIAHVGGFLSSMNAELIIREVHILLQEIATYEEPRISLGEAPTLSSIAKNTSSHLLSKTVRSNKRIYAVGGGSASGQKGHLKDISDIRIKDRKEAILSVIRTKHTASIKDISTLIRGVSEKTIQRELLALIGEGKVAKQGERRWSTYQLAG